MARGWATQEKTDLILDNLIAEKAKPMLIVMMDDMDEQPIQLAQVLFKFGKRIATIQPPGSTMKLALNTDPLI